MSRKQIVLLVIGAAVLTLLIGVIGTNMFVSAQKSACDLLQSAAGQVSPQANPPTQPQTAAQCKQLVDTTTPFTFFVITFGACVFIMVIGVFAATFWVFFGPRPDLPGHDHS